MDKLESNRGQQETIALPDYGSRKTYFETRNALFGAIFAPSTALNFYVKEDVGSLMVKLVLNFRKTFLSSLVFLYKRISSSATKNIAFLKKHCTRSFSTPISYDF